MTAISIFCHFYLQKYLILQRNNVDIQVDSFKRLFLRGDWNLCSFLHDLVILNKAGKVFKVIQMNRFQEPKWNISGSYEVWGAALIIF